MYFLQFWRIISALRVFFWKNCTQSIFCYKISSGNPLFLQNNLTIELVFFKILHDSFNAKLFLQTIDNFLQMFFRNDNYFAEFCMTFFTWVCISLPTCSTWWNDHWLHNGWRLGLWCNNSSYSRLLSESPHEALQTGCETPCIVKTYMKSNKFIFKHDAIAYCTFCVHVLC